MTSLAVLESLSVDGLALIPSDVHRVQTVRGLGSPPPRRVDFVRAERHGVVDRTRFYEPRLIEVIGMTMADTDEELWDAYDELRGKLALADAARTLSFRRHGRAFDERVSARVATIVDDELVPGRPFVQWAVTLLAPDPRLYGDALRSGTYDPAAALSGGGVSFPLSFPLEFSTTTSSHLSLVNAGQFPTPPVLRIQGPVVNPSIDNDTTGETLRVVYSLGSADVVVIDVASRSVTLNGAERPDLLDARESTWWEMAGGTNLLRLRGTGMALGVTSLTCEYRDARI